MGPSPARLEDALLDFCALLAQPFIFDGDRAQLHGLIRLHDEDERALLSRLDGGRWHNDRVRIRGERLLAGTLGRAYYDFMASENLSAEGLVKASTIPQSTDDSIWFRERNREMHDLLHIVSGYGRKLSIEQTGDCLGERAPEIRVLRAAAVPRPPARVHGELHQIGKPPYLLRSCRFAAG